MSQESGVRCFLWECVKHAVPEIDVTVPVIRRLEGRSQMYMRRK